MKKSGILLSIILLASIGINAQSNWGFDLAHTGVRFSVAHMVISEVEGTFSKFEGTVKTTKEDFSDAEIFFKIDVNSINTEDAKRDEHLRSADFFNTEKYPDITFKSKSIEKVADNKYKITGDFNMHGVTKEITIDAKYGGTIIDPWGNTKAGFKVKAEINRVDWNLKYNSVMDSGGLMIGEDVEIVCNIELIKS
ncbi:MAG: YceI family protein [Chlorobi bacterium]|nr:YceI family protein [Chlorobiota bacterium]